MIRKILNSTFCGAIFISLQVVAFSQTPAKVESDMLAALERISSFGTYAGNYDEEKSNKANEDLRSLLVKHGKRQDILKYAFPKLTAEMDVATSQDGKLRIYSWDTQTGGTMHFNDCVFQYQGSSGRVQTWVFPKTNESDAGAAYSRIFQASSQSGPIYLANSMFIAQGSTHMQTIEAFRILGDRLEVKPKVIKTRSNLTNMISFEYNPFTLDDRNENDLVSFDAKAVSFRFPVVLAEDAGSGRVTSRSITYKFNGTHFVKVN